MIKIWQFIRNKFLTKKFITFGFIGVLNTGINMVVYKLSYYWVGLGTSLPVIGAFFSQAIAFIAASIFSYFANSIFTFKPNQRTYKQFTFVMVVFLVRLLISATLTALFDYMIINWFNVDYTVTHWAFYIAPFLGSALLIPIAYFALDYVFKKTDKIKKDL